ncbi:hypothetical protein TIFTF001_031055 [Ficus carica]|uniref:Uncharacterized protein n=1 Tax=Ficus carica TaxID=3494 RepID=A0AA88J0H3_FICCA|nr:hypothetical protein TIFTF001_031055 [Ficus carica]
MREFGKITSPFKPVFRKPVQPDQRVIWPIVDNKWPGRSSALVSEQECCVVNKLIKSSQETVSTAS